MERVPREIVRHARQLAREVDARAVVVHGDAMTGGGDELGQLARAVDFPTVVVTRSRAGALPPPPESAVWVRVPDVHVSRAGQVKAALLVCLARGVLHRGDRVIRLSGVGRSRALDTLSVLDLGGERLELLSLFDSESFGGGLAPGCSSG